MLRDTNTQRTGVAGFFPRGKALKLLCVCFVVGIILLLLGIFVVTPYNAARALFLARKTNEWIARLKQMIDATREFELLLDKAKARDCGITQQLAFRYQEKMDAYISGQTTKSAYDLADERELCLWRALQYLIENQSFKDVQDYLRDLLRFYIDSTNEEQVFGKYIYDNYPNQYEQWCVMRDALELVLEEF